MRILRSLGLALVALSVPGMALASSGQSLSTVVEVSVDVVNTCNASVESSSTVRVKSDCTETTEKTRREVRTNTDYTRPVITFDRKVSVRNVNF